MRTRTLMATTALATLVAASSASAGNGIVQSSDGVSANVIFTIPTVPGQQNVCIDNSGQLSTTCVGHNTWAGPAPAIVNGFGSTTGGTQPFMVSSSNDNAGRITVGSGGSSSGTITFASSWGYAPICSAEDETTNNPMRPTPAANGTTLTITGTMVGNDVISWQCSGIPNPGSGPPVSAYYVSNNGSDSNDGLSQSTPFQHFGAAQTAMRAQPSNGIKTTFIMSAGGTFTLGSAFTMTSADNGTTWQANGTDQPLIDGNLTLTNMWILNGTSGITVQGLTFQNAAAVGSTGTSRGALLLLNATANNVIANHFFNNNMGMLMSGAINNLVSGNQFDNSGKGDTAGGTCSSYPSGATVNCGGAAMEVQNTSNGNTIQYNLINGANGQNTHGGCIYMHGVNNNLITHNYCENTVGMGIGIEDFGSTTHNSNNVISFNILSNINTSSQDSGGIYILGRDQPNVGATVIDHNYLTNPIGGQTNSQNLRDLYIDDCASNSTWTNNIVVNGGDGTHTAFGGSPFEIHVGSNNKFQNNIAVLGTSAAAAILVQSDSGSGTCSTTMTGNQFTTNIITSTQTSPVFGQAFHGVGATQLNVSTLELWKSPGVSWGGTSGVSGFTFSGISLTNPLFVAPTTVDPTTKMANFNFQAGSPAPALGFQQIDQSQIGLVNPSTAHWPYTY